jgi:hypothetical protein
MLLFSAGKGKSTPSPFSTLASIKTNLPVKEQVEKANNFYKYNVKDDLLLVGSKIVRPVAFFNTGRKMILDPSFQVNNRGAFLIRPENPRTSSFFSKYHVATNKREGIVCFCNNKIPKDWIYFTVDSVSDHYNFAVVSFHCGTEEELLSMYDFPKV